MLPAEMLNLRLETGEAAGERRERECRLWVTLNTGCRGRVLGSTNLLDIYTLLSHSLLPLHKRGRALFSPVPPAASGTREKGAGISAGRVQQG